LLCRDGYDNRPAHPSNKAVLADPLRNLLSNREHKAETGNWKLVGAVVRSGAPGWRVSQPVDGAAFPDQHGKHRILRKLGFAKKETAELIVISGQVDRDRSIGIPAIDGSLPEDANGKMRDRRSIDLWDEIVDVFGGTLLCHLVISRRMVGNTPKPA
jgi:hypothetical protein